VREHFGQDDEHAQRELAGQHHELLADGEPEGPSGEREVPEVERPVPERGLTPVAEVSGTWRHPQGGWLVTPDRRFRRWSGAPMLAVVPAPSEPVAIAVPGVSVQRVVVVLPATTTAHREVGLAGPTRRTVPDVAGAGLMARALATGTSGAAVQAVTVPTREVADDLCETAVLTAA
jgi:hypothetical protein